MFYLFCFLFLFVCLFLFFYKHYGIYQFIVPRCLLKYLIRQVLVYNKWPSFCMQYKPKYRCFRTTQTKTHDWLRYFFFHFPMVFNATTPLAKLALLTIKKRYSNHTKSPKQTRTNLDIKMDWSYKSGKSSVTGGTWTFSVVLLPYDLWETI